MAMQVLVNKKSLGSDQEPYWIVEFNSEKDIKLVASRSVSIRNCVELWAHAETVSELHTSLKNCPIDLMLSHFEPNKSFKIEVETFCRHFTQAEKVNKLEAFSYLPISGPVNLQNPDLIMQYIEYYGIRANDPPEDPCHVFFGRLITNGLRQIIKNISLKTRKFIGNTSMDPQLSLLMANQAKIKDGDVVLDPFVGSGSLLVAAALFGGYVLGTDIDYLMLHGRTRPSRIKQKVREADESIKANMKQYNLEHKYLDILVNDFSVSFWRDDFQFDAIITDPPYGIREATEKIGTTKQNYKVKEEHLSTHVPAKIDYGISHIYRDLLLFAAKHLKVDGCVVCWFPLFRDDYEEKCLPSHPCFKLIANCEQGLSKLTARRLLTFEKVRDPTPEELAICDSEIADFRAKYYIARDETRKERRMKEAKIRQDNKEKYKKL